MLDEDVVHEINEGSVRAPARKLSARLPAAHGPLAYKETVEDLVVFGTPAGDRAAAGSTSAANTATDSGTSPAKGQNYRLRVGAFFEIRDNKIARVTNTASTLASG